MVFGNGTTLNSEMETWRPWLTWIREQGAEMSAEQLMPGDDFPAGLEDPWGEDPWEAPRQPMPTDDRTVPATSSPLPPAAFPSSHRPASFPPASAASGPSRPRTSFPPATAAASGPIGPIRPSQAASFPPARTSAAAQVGTLSEARFQTDRTIEDLVATTVCQPASAVSLNKADNNWTEYAAEDGRIWEHNEVTGESRWKDIEKL